MNLLLDTCTILYFELNPFLLSKKVQEALVNKDSEIYISTVSVTEIACGFGKKFELKKHWRPWLRETIEANNWIVEPIDFEIAEEAYSLPDPFHKDPADRILVATSRIKNLTLVTNDQLIRNYPFAQVMW